MAQCPEEATHESRVAVGNDFLWYAVMGEYVGAIQFCYFFGGNRFVAREE